MSVPDINIEAFTEKVWHLAYPDRRRWDQLEPDTRQEWVRVMAAAFGQFKKSVCVPSESALFSAETLIGEIMRDEVNAQDECEKWLREYGTSI